MKPLFEKHYAKLMLATLAAGVALIACAPAAKGQSCGTVTTNYAASYATNHHVDKKVDTVIVTPTVATFIQIPLYTAVYVPPYAPPAPVPAPAVAAPSPPANAEMKELLQLMRGMDARIKRLESSPASPPVGLKAPGGANPGLQALGAKCASCHSKDDAADKGGAFVMFEGGRLLALTDRQKSRIMIRTQKQTMPPKDSGLKLSDEEAASLVALFDTK